MEYLPILVGGAALLLGVFVLWNVRQIQKHFAQLKRDVYYQEQKVKSISHKIDAAIEALRIHLTHLSKGQSIDEALIREGALYQEILSEDAAKLLSPQSPSKDVFVLDVRTAGEFVKGHLAGAIHLAVEDLDVRYQTDIPQNGEKILVYCAGGDRSRLACEFLSRNGFTNVFLLKHGLQEWKGPLEGAPNGPLIQISSKVKTESYSS